MLCVSCEGWPLSFGTAGFGVSEFFLSLLISVITYKSVIYFYSEEGHNGF